MASPTLLSGPKRGGVAQQSSSIGAVATASVVRSRTSFFGIEGGSSQAGGAAPELWNEKYFTINRCTVGSWESKSPTSTSVALLGLYQVA